MAKQLSFDSAARDALRRGIDQVANAVRVTLGPRGRSVVLERGFGVPTLTSDGVTVAREIELADPLENMGAQLIKEVSARTQEVAGDGTTTATVLAQALFHDGLRHVAAGAHPMAVKRGIDRAVAAVVADLAARSATIEGPDRIAQVAALAAGDDREIGDLIARAMAQVGRDGVIVVEEARTTGTALAVVEGMQFDRGYLSPYFITDPERMEVALESPFLLLHDRRLAGLGELLPLLDQVARLGRPLLVVAEDVEGEVLAALVVNKLRGTLQAAAVRAPGFGDRQRALLADLAVLTGGEVVSAETGRRLENAGLRDLGQASRAVIDKDSTTIVGGGGDRAALAARAGEIRRRIEEATSDPDRDQLRKRLAYLLGSVAVIHVGAATEIELKERKARLEDALAATRAAVEEGVVPGGGVALLRSAAALDGLAAAGDEAFGVATVRRALAEPLRRLAANAGADGGAVVERVLGASGATGWNALTLEFEDLEAQGIVDPTKVVRVALQHAASIAGLLLTTDALVAEAPAPKGRSKGRGTAGGPGPAGPGP